ncbi:MAG: MaoC family dehydratase [Bryobacteraceae bacterium]
MSATAGTQLDGGMTPGAVARLRRTITREEIEAFARFSGDFNPLHVDEAFAARTPMGRPVAHGMILASLVSTLIGMHLPGPGALWVNQTFRWLTPVFAGDSIEVTLTVVHVSPATKSVRIRVEAMREEGGKVMDGEGTVLLLQTRPEA